jgi:hypothetical protein
LVATVLRIPRVALNKWLEARRWCPELCREETGRPTLRGPKPKVPAVTPAEPVAEVPPVHEVSE